MNNIIQKEHLTRQSDLIDSDAIAALKVLVIGAGAIGSFATLALAKMGCEDITVYDFDEVDTVNINSQFYRFKDIGVHKVVALSNIVHDYAQVTVKTQTRRYTKDTEPRAYDLVLMAVDSMQARAEIFPVLQCKYMIDTRMSAEKYTQYVVDMRNAGSKDTYKKTLYTDGEAVAERCTAKATIYTALTAASMVCKSVKNILAKEPYAHTILMDLNKSSNNVMMFERK